MQQGRQKQGRWQQQSKGAAVQDKGQQQAEGPDAEEHLYFTSHPGALHFRTRGQPGPGNAAAGQGAAGRGARSSMIVSQL